MRRLLRRVPPRSRMVLQFLADAAVWAVALVAAVSIRYLDVSSGPDWRGVVALIAVAVLVQAVAGMLSQLYRGRYIYGSYDEVRGVVAATVVTGVVLLVIDIIAADLVTPGGRRPVPLAAVLVATCMALIGMLAVRYLLRRVRESGKRPEDAEPALIFGVGDAGSQLVMSMLRDANSPYLPVGLLDDAPHKQRLTISGVKTLGTRLDIADAAAETGATALIIATTTASARTVREVTKSAEAAGLHVKIVPPLHELIGGRVGVTDLRDVDLPDLLGRHEIKVDLVGIAGYLSGKRVLVTGAGGSIGSELCRQLMQFGPGALVMLDRDESALHAVEMAIYGRALLTSESVVLADIRDAERVREVFRAFRPQVVFHAAALKHLPVLERHVAEAVKTNIAGTWNVLDAAMDAGVERFVNISTDKAADPVSVLGCSKRVAERLTAWVAQHDDGTYLSVRFGNVLGSRGSAIQGFLDQIARGGPVTVTDPRVTRYFMTVQEAVMLVIQAAAVGSSGETLVLDMGEPVSIDELARTLIARSGGQIEVVYTGLRPGEKVEEALFGATEQPRPSSHPLVRAVDVPPSAPDVLAELDPTAPTDQLRATLAGAAGAPASDVEGELRHLASGRVDEPDPAAVDDDPDPLS